MKEILREVGMITRCFESIANIEFKELELSKNQYIYLVRISEQPGIILEALSDLLKVDRSTASRAVKKLFNSGFIEKVDNARTGKKIKLYPSDKGKQIYSILRSDEEYSNSIALDGFKNHELIVLLSYLKRIRNNIEPDWELVKKGGSRQYRNANDSSDENATQNHIQILDYLDEHFEDYREISYSWLKKYQVHEPEDDLVLNSPRKVILDNGGCIFIAKKDDRVVGTVSLVKADNDSYEISKLGVADNCQNLGIGSELMKTAILRAYNLKASKVFLYTNSKLDAAIHLYQRFGFNVVSENDGKYEQADIVMELKI